MGRGAAVAVESGLPFAAGTLGDPFGACQSYGRVEHPREHKRTSTARASSSGNGRRAIHGRDRERTQTDDVLTNLLNPNVNDDQLELNTGE